MKIEMNFLNFPFSKYRYLFFLLSFLPFSFLLSSCGQKSLDEAIIGEWKVEKVDFPEMDIAPSLIEDFRNEMLSSVYTFNEGGKFNLRSGLIPDGVDGTWRVNEEKGELFIEYTAAGQYFKSTYQIKITDENTLLFKQKLGGDLGSIEATLKKN